MQLLKELASAAWLNAALLDIDDDADYAPLKKAINSDISKILERIFDLLSFIYPAQNILRARDNINSQSSNQRAIALEIVDLLLPLLQPARPRSFNRRVSGSKQNMCMEMIVLP